MLKGTAPRRECLKELQMNENRKALTRDPPGRDLIDLQATKTDGKQQKRLSGFSREVYLDERTEKRESVCGSVNYGGDNAENTIGYHAFLRSFNSKIIERINDDCF